MNWKTGVIIGIVGISYATFLAMTINDHNKCDRHIIFNDSTQMDCRVVNSYDNGTTHIRLCDGKLLIVPTSRIKEITEIE